MSATPRADALALGLATGREVLLLEPASDAAHLAAAELAAGGRPLVVGDADAWAANWMLAGQLRDRGPVVVHGGRTEFRAVVRERVLPPVLDRGADQCWVLVDGSIRRRTWPSLADGGNPLFAGALETDSAPRTRED